MGNGYSVRFWKDNWLGVPLMLTCNIDQEYLGYLNDKVNAFILDGEWLLPLNFQHMYTMTSQAIMSIFLAVKDGADQVVWAPASSGILTPSEVYKVLCASSPYMI